ncbi:MAG: cytochrome c [Caldilineaceae bacterium]|nr:cytochrome c [Caldilineaceae bacterium]
MSAKRNSLFVGIGIVLVIGWLVLAPPRFWLNLTKPVEPTAEIGAQLVESYECRDCHRIGGEGALKAPGLDAIVQRQQSADPALVTLRLWLRNPDAVKPNTAMPNFRLSDSEIEAILLYLAQQ